MRKFSSALSFMLIAAFMVTLISCGQQKASSPLLNEKINSTNLLDIARKMKDDKDVTREEIDLFSNGVQRLSFNKDSLNGKTVGQVIEMENKLRRTISNNSLLTSTTKAEMKLAVGFKLDKLVATTKKVEDKDVPLDALVYTLANISDKKIKKVQGFVYFQINGQNIKRFTVNADNQPIEPGKGIRMQQVYKMDQNSQKVYQAQKQNIKMTTSFQPIIIEFEDGKKLELKLAR